MTTGLWTGHGPPPPVIVGAVDGEEYLDLDNGDLYQLEGAVFDHRDRHLVTTGLAARVLNAMGPALADRAGDLLEPLVDALTGALADVDALVEPGGQRWAPVYDFDATPFPALLGRMTGTTVTGGLTPAQQRAFIRERASWHRGTPAALLAAIRQVLDVQRVDLLERTTSPWAFSIRVYSDELGAHTVEEIRTAALTQKPVGLVMTVEAVTGASYAHMSAEHGVTFADWATEFPTYSLARAHKPEEGTIP